MVKRPTAKVEYIQKVDKILANDLYPNYGQ